jgi:hypothetical protein
MYTIYDTLFMIVYLAMFLPNDKNLKEKVYSLNMLRSLVLKTMLGS